MEQGEKQVGEKNLTMKDSIPPFLLINANPRWSCRGGVIPPQFDAESHS